MAVQGSQLTSEAFRFTDIDEFTDFVFEQGWTDGFPVFPPTEKKVREILDYIKRPAGESLGVLQPGEGEVTMEAIAINCAMAGCRPEYMPVVIAAMEAMLDERCHIMSAQSSTVGPNPIAIISGPVVKKLDFNYADGALVGTGHRANGTIARAIRLILWNVGMGKPGLLSKCVFGEPGRWGYLICERPQDDGNPWEPFHVSAAGLKPEDSAVSVLGANGGMLGTGFIRTGANLERNIAALGKQLSGGGLGGCTIIVLNPDAAKFLADAGWTKERFRDTLRENAFSYVRDLKRRHDIESEGVPLTNTATNNWARRVNPEDDDAKVYTFVEPSHLQIMVSGGWGGGHVSYRFSGGGHAIDGFGLVTKKINWDWDRQEWT